MEETKELITKDDICSKVYIIRGQQVMLDKDLAEIYGYEVKKLNQQVKRNIERFPEDFMFRLSNSEIDSVRSQIVTSRKKDFFAGQEGGRRYLPYAFTEQGIYMLATVLRGELAEQQSIFIMRTFREMRHYIRQNQQFVTRNEMNFKPMTYMNNSGECIREVMDYYKCDIDDFLVIFDDISLDVGKLRLRAKGSAGGHNGIKSIIAHLGSDKFKRIKFGVGDKPKNWDLADWVLGKFPTEEYATLREANNKACEAVECILTDGIESGMNKYNG